MSQMGRAKERIEEWKGRISVDEMEESAREGCSYR